MIGWRSQNFTTSITIFSWKYTFCATFLLRKHTIYSTILDVEYTLWNNLKIYNLVWDEYPTWNTFFIKHILFIRSLIGLKYILQETNSPNHPTPTNIPFQYSWPYSFLYRSAPRLHIKRQNQYWPLHGTMSNPAWRNCKLMQCQRIINESSHIKWYHLIKVPCPLQKVLKYL